MSRCLPSSLVSSKTRMRHVCPPLQGQPAGQDLALPCLLFCFLFRAAEEQENLLSCFLNTKWVGPARANIPSEYTPRLHRTGTKAGPQSGLPLGLWLITLSPWEELGPDRGPRNRPTGVRSAWHPEHSSLLRKTNWSRQIKDGIRERRRHREALPRKQGTGDPFSCQTGEHRDRGLLSPASHICRVKGERNRDKQRSDRSLEIPQQVWLPLHRQ